MRWRRRTPGRERRKGRPAISMRLKDPASPGRHLVVRVTPLVKKGVPQVHVWFQAGRVAGAAALAEDEARALAKALIDGIEESKPAAEPAADPG